MITEHHMPHASAMTKPTTMYNLIYTNKNSNWPIFKKLCWDSTFPQSEWLSSRKQKTLNIGEDVGSVVEEALYTVYEKVN
jgi:hypothetical protein